MSLHQIENLLSSQVTSTWDRLRGSDELNTFISRREAALELVETDELVDF